MLLETFLSTASADNEIALQEARNYQPASYIWRIEGPVRKTQVETGIIINNTYSRLETLINTPETNEAVKSLATTILYVLKKLYEPEFYINLGDAEVSSLFNAAIQYGVLNLDEAQRITAAATYTPDKPFANISLHSVLVARKQCPVLDIEPIDGYFVIEVNADVEAHSPHLYGLNTRTNKVEPIGRFPILTNAGRYELKNVFKGYSSFKIDDAYGVITCLKTL